MDALEALQTRRSTRSFNDQSISKELLEKIVNAGRLAATARNIQPWKFVVVTNKKNLKTMASLADHGRFIDQAPVSIVIFCEDTKYYLEDGSAATQNILIAAHALGVQSCWVAGDKKDYIQDVGKLLGAPAGNRLVSIIALGYEDMPIPRPMKKPLAEVMGWEKYPS